MTMRILGGSAAFEATNSNVNNTNNGTNGNKDFLRLPKLSLFREEGLYPTFLKENTPIKGYILPAFDSTLNQVDTARPTSYESYRDHTRRDEKTGLNPFTGWFVPIGFKKPGSQFVTGGVYTYFGRSMSTFISPASFGGKDPIIDLTIWIRSQKKNKNDSRYAYLLDRPAFDRNNPNRTPIAIPYGRMMFMVNAFCTGSNPHDPEKDVMKNRVLLISELGFNELIKQLNDYKPGAMLQTLDPDNPIFRLGDVTNPKRAMLFESSAIKSNITFTTLKYPEATMNPMKGELEVQASLAEIPENVLAGRYDIMDADKCICIPTYDDIVKQILVEGLIPREALIESGVASKCAHFPTPEEIEEYIADYMRSHGAQSAAQQPAQDAVSNPSYGQPAAYAPVHQPVPAAAQPMPIQYPQTMAPTTSMSDNIRPTTTNEPDEIPGLGPVVTTQPTPVVTTQPTPVVYPNTNSQETAVPVTKVATAYQPSTNVAQQPKPVSGGLTEAEREELESLRDMMKKNPAMMDINKINRISELMSREPA